MKRVFGLGVVLAVYSSSTALVLAQRPEGVGYGPPSWVLDAWDSGNAPVVPADGPPAWVVQSWANGERPRANRGFGPPPWVFERHAMAAELGLPGPPLEVIKAWENGEGFGLSGPPAFVLDLLGF